jgi:acetyl esterase
MSRDYWCFLGGMAAVLVPLFIYLVYQKSVPWSDRPDQIFSYREVDGHALKLHVFKAQGPRAEAKAPALLFFHGGAWQYGDPRQFFPQCRYFSRHGLTCISAQYRIESMHGTDPRAAIQDARAALSYLHRHAQSLDIDSERIVVGGGSAGGHLAASLGVSLPLAGEGVDAPSAIRPSALVLYNPMLDLAPCRPDHHLVAAYWQAVSPMHHIDENAPPTLILLGTADPEVPVPTAQAYCAAMRAVGVSCELELYQGAKHGFFNERVDSGRYFRATNERVLRFLNDLGYARVNGG